MQTADQRYRFRDSPVLLIGIPFVDVIVGSEKSPSFKEWLNR
jgi:hypothetical protein